MVCLSRARKLLGSGWSSFTMAACLLSPWDGFRVRTLGANTNTNAVAEVGCRSPVAVAVDDMGLAGDW